MTRHHITATFERENENGTVTASHEVRIRFAFDPGCPAWGGARGERPINPPEEPTVEFLGADIEDIDALGRRIWTPAPETIADWAEAWLDEHPDVVAEHVAADLEPDPDAARDRRNDDVRERA